MTNNVTDPVDADSTVIYKDASLNTQMFRFIITGGLSAIVDFGTTAFLTFVFGWADVPAKAVGFMLGTLTAYYINRRWTFQAEASTRRFVITMITYLVTFAVQVGLYKLCIPWLEDFGLTNLWARMISFVIAQGTATIINFAIQRFLIFRK